LTGGDGRLVEPIGRQVERHASDWAPLLRAWRDSPAGRQLAERIEARRSAGAVIYPAEIFRALACTPLSATRVVILGQDPYHGPGQAEGLAFSVPPGQRVPPSLRNIFKELQRDLALVPPRSGSLLAWTRQGVLLLNTCLSVEAGRAASHAKFGWEALTDAIVLAAFRDASPKVFMLWGAHAQSKAPLLTGTAAGRHLVLRCNHPSPLSATRPPAPFAGCGHFAQAATFLAAAAPSAPRLDWRLDAAAV
jgi:uracil-DNA glycosylase